MQTTPPAGLFSFGTLTLPAVQESLFGSPVPHAAAALLGHGLVDVPITDPEVIRLSGSAVHRGLARRVADRVDGVVLTLTAEQLAAADAYEVDAYARRRVLIADPDGVAPAPRTAWAYVAADPLAAAERIAVAGDSIAFGLSDPDGGWAGHLARHHGNADGRRLWNLAVPGLTLAELDRHLDAEASLRRVDTVLIGAGINDLRADHGPTRPADLVTRMDTLCARREAAGCRPVVLTPLWVDVPRADAEFGMHVRLRDAAEYRERLLTWGEQTHRDVVDLWPVLEDRPERLTDGVHPDVQGHAMLWDRLRGSGSPRVV